MRGFGVPLLIVLSAFLITRIIINAPNNYTFRKHFLRRFYRIAPAYFSFLCVTIAADYFLDDKWTFEEIIHALTHTVNYWNAKHGHTSTVSHVWTLSILEQFFIVSFFTLPFLVSLRPKSFIIASVTILITFTIYRSLAYNVFNAPDRFIYNDFFSRIDQYMVGVILGYWYEKKRAFPKTSTFYSILLLTLGILLIKTVRNWEALHYSLGFLIEAACAATAIVAFTSIASNLKILDSKLIVLLASASYSAYLWHGWAITVSEKYLDNSLLIALTSPAISFCAGVTSYTVLEKYFLTKKEEVILRNKSMQKQ